MGLYTVIPREALEMGCIFHELFLQDHRIPCLKETKAVIYQRSVKELLLQHKKAKG